MNSRKVKAIALRRDDPMILLNRVMIIIVAAILIFLSACSGTPTSEPSATEPAASSPPQAVLDAQAWLTTQLGVAIEDTRLIDFEQTEWSDSCLGLGGPAESCAQVMTPGWKVVAEVAGQQYEVRTNEDGTVIKVVQN